MKLNEITQPANPPKGTFVGVKLDAESKQKILDLIGKLKLEEPIPEDKLHSTLVYSDKKSLDGFKSNTSFGESGFPKVKPVNFNVFPNSQNPGTGCLVMELDSDYLHTRHDEIVSKYDVQEKFPTYRPHITLSYNYAGEPPDSKYLQDLGELNIESEYDEPINDNFAKSL
jgi:2'-5' RNA ligase